MDDATVAAAARALMQAEETRTPIPPLSATYPDLDEDGAYRIQKAWVDMKIARGRQIKGHKIGLTSRAIQRTANFNEPDYGALLDDMLLEDGAEIPADRFIAPMLECELAFILGRELSGPCSIFDVLAATEYVTPALEIIDLRMTATDPKTGKKRGVLDSIADNAASAAIVLGGRPVRPDTIDLRWVSAICQRNLIIEETGVAAAVLNHPARGIEWLANKLAQRGTKLQPGEVVMCGSFTHHIDVRRGDVFHVDYGPLGVVACGFV